MVPKSGCRDCGNAICQTDRSTSKKTDRLHKQKAKPITPRNLGRETDKPHDEKKRERVKVISHFNGKREIAVERARGGKATTRE